MKLTKIVLLIICSVMLTACGVEKDPFIEVGWVNETAWFESSTVAKVKVTDYNYLGISVFTYKIRCGEADRGLFPFQWEWNRECDLTTVFDDKTELWSRGDEEWPKP